MSLQQRLSGLLATQPAPPTAVLVVAAVLALLAVAGPGLWPYARHLITLVHEIGHVLAAALTGRRVTGVRLNSDTSGLTTWIGQARGPGATVAVLSGYPAPAVAGLATAAAVSTGRPGWVLLGLALVIGVAMLLIRNLYGGFVLVIGAAASVAIIGWTPDEVQQTVAWALAMFLLLGSLRALTELSHARTRHRRTDADILAGVAGGSPTGWFLLLMMATVLAAVLGGWVLAGAALARLS